MVGFTIVRESFSRVTPGFIIATDRFTRTLWAQSETNITLRLTKIGSVSLVSP